MSTKKAQILKFAKALMIVALGIFFVFLILRTRLKQGNLLCTKVQIDVKDSEQLRFVTPDDVQAMLSSENIINEKVQNINLNSIEEKLEKNDFIDNAEVYLNFDGALKIDIVQKKPLYRIINNNNVSYYISEKAYRVPLSTNFTPRLIVATGHIPNVDDISKDSINNKLKKLIDFIQKSNFWNAMIGQVEVKRNGDFVLIPKLKGHTILLGDVEDIDEKFQKLEIFYKEALDKTDWTKYKQINLKYKGQIICSK